MRESISYQQPEADALDWRTPVRRASHAIRRHALLIGMSCVVALGLLLVYQKLFPPIYVAEARIQGEAVQDIVRSNYYAGWNVFRKGDQRSEPELITSGRVGKAVVTRLGLTFDDVHHSFLTHAAYLWSDSWLGKKYRAFKEWLFPPDPQAFKPTPEQIEYARTVDSFVKSVAVEGISGTVVAKVSVKAPSHRAAEYANTLLDVYLEERSRMAREEADAALNALQVEVARAAQEIGELDRKKRDFDIEHKVVLDFEKDKLVVGNWATLQSSIMDARASIASLEASRAVIEEQLAREPPEIVSARTLQDSRTKAMLEAREMELNGSLQQARERFVADSPEVVQLEKLLAQTRADLRREPDKVEVGQERVVNPVYSELRQRLNSVLTQLASAKAALAAKQAPLARLEERMAEVPALVSEITDMNRRRAGLELRYSLLRERAMQAEVSRATIALATPSVRIIDPAEPPLKPAWPKNIILVPAVIALGLFVGFAIALLAEMFSPRVNRDRLAARPDIPVYALIDLRPEPSRALGSPPPPLALPVSDRLRRVS